MDFFALVIIFHGLQFWLFRVYSSEYDIDYIHPTKFESMLFWPQLLGILDYPSKKKIKNMYKREAPWKNV